MRPASASSPRVPPGGSAIEAGGPGAALPPHGRRARAADSPSGAPSETRASCARGACLCPSCAPWRAPTLTSLGRCARPVQRGAGPATGFGGAFRAVRFRRARALRWLTRRVSLLPRCPHGPAFGASPCPTSPGASCVRQRAVRGASPAKSKGSLAIRSIRCGCCESPLTSVKQKPTFPACTHKPHTQEREGMIKCNAYCGPSTNGATPPSSS
jgi:hypothetical protein